MRNLNEFLFLAVHSEALANEIIFSKQGNFTDQDKLQIEQHLSCAKAYRDEAIKMASEIYVPQ